jgi:hypothetical protein
MSPNVFDQACRYLARLDPVGLLCWLLNLPASAFAFKGWLDTRTIPFPGEPDRTCDTVAFVLDLTRGGIPWAVVIEFQIEADPLMFGRLLVYMGQVWIARKPYPEPGDRFAVGAVVVNLTGRGSSSYNVDWPEADLGTSLRNPDRDMASRQAAKELARIAAGEVGKVALPLIPLMQGGGEDDNIRQWVEIASAEPDAKKRADYGGLALVFAEAANSATAWKKALEGWNVIQSQQVLEWQAQARKEGRDEGRKEALLDLLQDKFGAVPGEVAAAVRSEADQGKLRRWSTIAGRVDSLEQFRRDAGL